MGAINSLTMESHNTLLVMAMKMNVDRLNAKVNGVK